MNIRTIVIRTWVVVRDLGLPADRCPSPKESSRPLVRAVLPSARGGLPTLTIDRIRGGVLTLVVMLAWCLVPLRLGAGDGATIWGVIEGPDGARLPGALVTLARRDGGARRAVAGPLGAYRIGGLEAGLWDIRVDSPGFSPVRAESIRLEPGASVRQDLRLTLAPFTERIDVRTSVPADSLEAPAIRESGARDVGEALAMVPGLWALRKGGIANDVVLRGMQSRDLNVLVDGDRVYGACPNHMDPPPFHVDFAEVERIEVAKGPFDVRNQGSLGGVVNIVTRDPEAGLHLAPSLSLGSSGFVNPAATMAWGKPRVSLLGGFSWRQAGVDRDGAGLLFTERANYLPSSLDVRSFGVGTGWGRVRYAPSIDTSVDASYTRQEADGVLYPYLQMDADYDDTDRVSAKIEHRRPRKTVSLATAQFYLTRVEHWMTDASRVTSTGTPRGWSMGTMARAQTWGGKASARVGRTLTGVEFYHRFWDASTELAGMKYAPQPSLPGVAVDVAGGFADYSRILGDRVLLEAGARLDLAWSAADPQKARTDLTYAYLGTRETARTDVLPSGKLRVSWRPGTGHQLSVGVGQTTRVPEANERFFGLRRMGTDWVGNPGLEPARNTGADVAYAWRRSRISLSASTFVSRVGDFITVRDVARLNVVAGVSNSRARTWANVDATLWGGELTSSVSLTSHLVASGDLSFVRGSQAPKPEEGMSSTALPEIPPLAARLGLRYDDSRFFAAIDGSIAGRQDRVNDDLKEEPSAGYGLGAVAAGARHGRVALTVGLQNAFDRTYSPHLSYQRDPFRTGARVYGPGRTLYLNASARF